MSKEYKRGYRRGQKETVFIMLAIVSWTSIIATMLIKAGIFVM